MEQSTEVSQQPASAGGNGVAGGAESQDLTVDRFEQEAFQVAKLECDLIMEGGITSGVVYPRALVQLATRYRFRSIGGASAGAIAAAIAAAAEHGRDSGGFVKLQALPNELASRLLSLFQPTPRLSGVFNAFLATMRHSSVIGKVAGVLWNLFRAHWIAVLIGALSAAVYPWQGCDGAAAFGRNVFGVVVVAAAVLISVSFAVLRRLRRELPKHVFGICPGVTPSGEEDEKTPALTEWLTKLLDTFAGPRAEGSARHLTFGDLARKGIELKMMTTNLSMRRPYSIPLPKTRGNDEPEFAFRKDEWCQLFPKTVVEQMARRPVKDREGYFFVPEPDDLPVIVGVRMSLSFPILLSAVPLYRKDRTLRAEPAEIQELRRCVFSDGGISSDFPIHFFDSLLPSRPTFAISLGEYDKRRNGKDFPVNRVHMPKKAGSGIQLPISSITDVLGFAGSILTSARVWQDNLQSVLPGYRERIAKVALDKKEGGLNLNMPKERIDRLTKYGDLAGQQMLAFDFDEHRWRRFLASFASLYVALSKVHTTYVASFGEFLRRYPEHAQSYEQTRTWLGQARKFMDELDQFIAAQPPGLGTGEKIPRPIGTLRVTPDP